MKIRRSLLILLCGAFFAVPLKVYQLLRVVDYSTGFYKKGDFSTIALPVLLAVCIIAFFVSSLTCDEYPLFSPNHRSIPLGLISAGTAVVFGYISAAELIDASERVFTGVPGLIYSGFGMLSVVSFSFLALGFFRCENNIENSPFTMLPPIIWAAMRMVMTFLKFSSIANISENLYDLVMMAAILIFFVSTAKFMAGVSGSSSKWVFASGCTTVLMGLLTTVCRYCLALSNNQKWTHVSGAMLTSEETPFAAKLIDLCIVIFALGFLFHISHRAALMRGVSLSPAAAAAPYERNPYSSNQPQRKRQQPVPQNNNRMSNPQPRPNSPYVRQNPAYYPPQRQAMQPRMQSPYGMQQPYMMQGGYPPVFFPQPMYPQMPANSPYPAGGGADMYTSRGAGMRVTNDFQLRPFYDAPNKHGGLDDFRDGMLSGERALDVLRSSDSASFARDRFSNDDIAEGASTAELISSQQREISAMTDEVDRSLGSLIAEKDNAVHAPKLVSIDHGEGDIPVPDTDDDVPPPPPPRSVSLGSGRRGSKLSDHLRETRDRRLEEAERNRSHMTEGYFDEYSSGYGDVYFDAPRTRYPNDEYAYEEEYDEEGYEYEYPDEPYDDEYDDSDGYDTDYYDDDEDEYDEYDDDEDYDDDEYDDDDYYDDYGEY